MSRLARLREKLAEKGLDGFLAFKIENVFYLSGFTGDTGAVLITADAAYFFADSRFQLQASQEAEGYEVVPVERSYFGSIAEFISGRSLKRIGVEANHLTVGGFQSLQEKLGEVCTLVPEDQLIEGLRMVKEPGELDILKKAVELTEEAFSRLQPLIVPGVTEEYLRVELLKLMYEQGFTGPSFDFIIASGERGALPHGVASQKEIRRGELVTFDFGGIYKHYCSDMTRTLAIGEVDSELKEIYEVVRQAQQAAEEAAKPGMTGVELDKVARQVIEEAGYGQYFGHGLGHGVGLEVHELPTASPKGEIALEPGMVITIEPGIYIPGRGGVRIENEIVITEEGAQSLNRFPKELLSL
ncbi:MAG: aminopeptidase P family protein [Firmicutes bacterium]|nr:aminopeptidase P family protein [Bacillota bacterium]